jgi:hypothetical protein
MKGDVRWLASVPIAVLVVAFAVASSGTAAAPAPIVTVVRHGGLCASGSECRSLLRITDTTISGDGYVSRRLPPASRLALLRAIKKLSLAYLRAHPFKGTCPTAYDAAESTYRFRGFRTALPSCTYDLRGVEAVRLTKRLLATLRPRA